MDFTILQAIKSPSTAPFWPVQLNFLFLETENALTDTPTVNFPLRPLF